MNLNRWKVRGLGLLGLALLMIFSGCATMDKYVTQVHKKLPSWAKLSNNDYYYHKVRYSGETLSIISQWYTRDGENWKTLSKSNPQLDPDHIKIGTIIKIPEKLLYTRKPMPKNFVVAAIKRQKAKERELAKALARARPAPYYHRVRYSGETLSLIAKWYTGDFENWRALTKANPKVNPNHITAGDRIRIPNKLLHTKKPMPRSFVVGSVKTKKPKPSPPAPAKVDTAVTAEKQAKPPPDDVEVFELFGPK